MKNELNYAYAVARTRAVENRLLSSGTIEKLITSSSYNDAMKVLRDNGWELKDNTDVFHFLSARMQQVWEFLRESVPDKKELEILTVENDFHNIKAAVKCIFSGFSPESLYIRPTCVDTDILTSCVKTLDFPQLPDYAAEVAAKAYDIGSQTHNGQRIDIVIDVAALKRIFSLADSCSCSLLKEIANIKLAAANIKTAFRTANENKDSDYIFKTLCPFDSIDIRELANKASCGTEVLFEYLLKTRYAGAAEALIDGTTAFEKWADDEIIRICRKAKWKSLGFEPLVAYYYANLAEIKNVRIIMGAKSAGADVQTIRQRVRELYV